LDQDTEIQGALFSMDAVTGQVLAIEGGFNYEKSEFNRALQAQRQMGSSFKAMIFSAALEKGYTPATIIVDAPIVYNDDESGKWKPANFEEKFYGDTTFRQALIKSRNIPTIKIVQDVGVQYVIDFAKRVGMPTNLPNDLSISLGSGTISLAELTRAYSMFPRLGRRLSPIYYSTVKDRDGKLLEENLPGTKKPLEDVMKEVTAETPTAAPGAGPSPAPGARSVPIAANGDPGMPSLPVYPLRSDPDQVLDPRIAFVATHLMSEVVSFGTGHDAKQLGRPAAGKTGTTNDYQDAWFMGFTPTIVTGSWVGYDTSKPIGKGETGARAALPIWLDFMKEAVKNQPEQEFQVPPGVVFASIHPQTGKLAPPNASYAIKEAFIEGTEPKEGAPTGKGNTQPARSTGDFLKEDIE
jgi:penicillin-binding protein 1A